MPLFSPRRAIGVIIFIVAVLGALLARVGYLQTFGRQKTIEQAERQQHQTETLQARRGCIFDSTGMLMAGTVQHSTLFVDPKFIQEEFTRDGHTLIEMDQEIAKLAKILDKKPAELSEILSDKAESRFVKIAENLDEGTCDAITKLDLKGLGLLPTSARYYPMGSVGAHILGGTGKDNTGLEGLEMKFEKVLAGKDGSKRTLKDSRRRPMGVAAEDYLPPQHGQHLILTIDGNIQLIAEQELSKACEEFKAKRGEVIIMEPKSGDILAMANWPTFNPALIDETQPESRRNRCLTDPYEPGSTIKPFIAGPAMQWNVTRPDEIWPINSIHYNPFGKRTVTDVHFYGPLATWDVLVKSSNIGMSMIGQRMGNSKLHQALRSFGFGNRTGVELPGEDQGLINPLNKWGRDSTISVAQGYEVMVTPLQLCRAFCAYANGGRLIQPRIVKGVLDANGNMVARTPDNALNMLPAAIDPSTAAGMRRILCDVPVRGTATKARSNTWNIFGKTGTAHISEGKSGYSTTRFNSSFMGGAPAENPRLVVAMIIHDPDAALAHYGGVVSAPAAGKVLERSLAYLQVPASPELQPPPANIASHLYAFNAAVYKQNANVSATTD